MTDKIKLSAPQFTELNELAAAANGGRIVFATDDWFAEAENMIKDSEPVFLADKYTECGKWMDGWETRRKRIPGHDWCILKLGAPCIIKGVTVDTAFFTGNYAPKISIQGTVLAEKDEQLAPPRRCKMGTACSNEEHKQISKLKSDKWVELLPKTKLKPGYEETRKNFISIDSNDVCSHIRVNMYPDGGIARLRVYGEVQPNLEKICQNNTIDLISLENGGTCVGYSNAHYGHPRNLIKPNRGINMGDGWETMRRLDRPEILEYDVNGTIKVPGNEWAIFKMCCLGEINEIVVDTLHFKGNYADSVKIEGATLDEQQTLSAAHWITVVDSQKLCAHQEHYFNHEIINNGPFNYIKITMAPDGGFSRVRAFGKVF